MRGIRWLVTCVAVVTSALATATVAGQEEGKPLRAGMIGLDTSHVVEFTKLLNGPRPAEGLAGVRVVAAFPGGSADLAASRDRVEGFTTRLRDEFHVEIVHSIEALLARVDVVFLESVDGRTHLAQVEPVLKAGKPVFIDKPVAGTLADAVRIFQLAEEHKTPCFSSSSLRYSPTIRGLRTDPRVGEILGCDAYGPCPVEEHHPDLFWYGVHGVESLFTVMGTGCVSVTRVRTEGTELVTGVWDRGRVGTFRGIRAGKADYGAVAFGSKGIVVGQGYGGYEPLLVEVCSFFRTRRAPVEPRETLELFAFMEAADESRRRGGTTVTLESVLTQARRQADASGK